MTDEPRPGGFGALIVAKVACCGVLVLVATGVLSLNAIGTWLLEGGLIWLALATVLAVSGVLIWRLRTGGAAGPKTGSAAPRPADARDAPVARNAGTVRSR